MIRDTTSLPNEADGCLQESINSKDVLRTIENHNGKLGGLMTILGDIQSEYGYLPETSLRMVADETGVSLVDIYGVATFYHSFSLKPRGKHLVCVCLGTACHVRGAAMIVEELKRQLGIKVGQTTPDGEFTLETANCLGACAIGPIITADGRYFSKVDTTKVKAILEKVQVGLLEDEESLTAASDG
jgi:NADH-quinone oxidoreductase subunit E